jgi:hypothetical protein
MAMRKRQAGSQNAAPTTPSGLVLEAWAQGLMVGALIIMSAITLANMRRSVLLHKLILVEVSSDLNNI